MNKLIVINNSYLKYLGSTVLLILIKPTDQKILKKYQCKINNWTNKIYKVINYNQSAKKKNNQKVILDLL